jgi:hypothetical protein
MKRRSRRTQWTIIVTVASVLMCGCCGVAGAPSGSSPSEPSRPTVIVPTQSTEDLDISVNGGDDDIDIDRPRSCRKKWWC